MAEQAPKKFHLRKFTERETQEAKPPVAPPVSITLAEGEQGGAGERSERKGQRGTCWSVTINNPRPGEEECLVPGWTMTGQFEVGKTGTRHYQGCLKTPQVRWAAVKKMYPRANISLARNEFALQAYVRKEDTRASAIVSSGQVNIFQFQDIIAGDWKEEDWKSCVELYPRKEIGEIALIYVDELVRKRMRQGQRGAEWIAMNPLWRSVWKNFYADIIARYASRPSQPEQVHHECEISEIEAPQAEGVKDFCEESASDSEQEVRNEIC